MSELAVVLLSGSAFVLAVLAVDAFVGATARLFGRR